MAGVSQVSGPLLTGRVLVPVQLFVVALVVVVAVLLGRLLTGRLGVPDATAYVVLGVAAGFVPGLPAVQLSPDVVLLLFLPPLIYFAAFFSDPRETMAHIVPVVGQSVGLVLATAVAAAGALLLIYPDVGWAGALAFGAAIAPPDPVAATSVLAASVRHGGWSRCSRGRAWSTTGWR